MSYLAVARVGGVRVVVMVMGVGVLAIRCHCCFHRCGCCHFFFVIVVVAIMVSRASVAGVLCMVIILSDIDTNILT